MNTDSEKPFGAVDKTLLFIIAGLSDAADGVSALVFGIPVIGQAVYFGNAFLISPLIWATIQFWFIMKVGFAGRIGLINVAGGLLNVVGLPGGQIATVALAIYLANNPKLAVAAMAVVPGGAGAAAQAARGAAAAARAGGGAVRAAAAAERTAVAAERGAAGVARAERGAEEAAAARKLQRIEKLPERWEKMPPEEQEWYRQYAPSYAEEAERAAVEKEIPKEALGEKPEITEELPRKLFEEFPEPEQKKETEEEETAPEAAPEEEEEERELPKAA